MKNLFLIATAVAGMTLASCSSDEVVEVTTQNAIGFKAMTNKVSKADVDESNLRMFRVYGCTMDAGTSDNHSVIFNQTLVEYQTNGTWTYSPLQYWAKNKDYFFVAISSNINAFKWSYKMPESHDSNLAVAGFKGFGTVTFNNSFEDGAQGNSDLVYSYASKTTGSDVSNEGGVSFSFNHMLSRVIFSFTNGIEGNVYSFSISDLKLGGIISKASVELGKESLDWTKTSEESSTIQLGIASTDKVINKEQVGYVTNVESASHFIIPGNQQALSFSFKVTVYANGQEYSNHTRTGTIAVTDYKPGYSYKFNANLTTENISTDGVKPIEFSITAFKQWKDGSAGEVIFDQPKE